MRRHRRASASVLASVPDAVARHAGLLCSYATVEPTLLHDEVGPPLVLSGHAASLTPY